MLNQIGLEKHCHDKHDKIDKHDQGYRNRYDIINHGHEKKNFYVFFS